MGRHTTRPPEPGDPPPSGPAPSGPAPSGPAPSGPAPSGPAPSGPAPSGPAPSGPERGPTAAAGLPGAAELAGWGSFASVLGAGLTAASGGGWVRTGMAAALGLALTALLAGLARARPAPSGPHDSTGTPDRAGPSA